MNEKVAVKVKQKEMFMFLIQFEFWWKMEAKTDLSVVSWSLEAGKRPNLFPEKSLFSLLNPVILSDLIAR